MRLPSPNKDRRHGVMLTPMIDVVFLLLVFFLWTASFRLQEHLLPSRVSARMEDAVSAEPLPPEEADFEEVVIRILWEENRPHWRINAMPVDSLAEVRQTLAGIAAVKTDAPVIVHPDPPVPLGHVIDVYDLTRLEGFQSVQFAASDNS